MSDDPYEGFAERYDLFFGRSGEHPEVAAFFREIFHRNGVRRVLDCACGTGHDLLLFHSMGLDAAGSDISDSMLGQARKNLTEAGARIPLVKADYRELPGRFSDSFDAVVCLSSSIFHMPGECEAVRAFRSMREVLRDGGILVLTQGTTDKQWREKPRFILAGSKPDVSRLFVIDYLERGARYNVIDVRHGEAERGLKVWSMDYPCILLKEDYARLLPQAGFRSVEFYGSHSFEPYDTRASDRLIIVAQR